MADRRTNQHRDSERQDPVREKPHRFINETIIRQPMSRRQIARRILLTFFCAVLFGVLSAVCFVVSKPVAERLLGQEETETASQITIPKDEPETTASEVQPETTESSVPADIDQIVREEIGKYRYSVEDLNKLYSNLRAIANNADDSLVVVHSIQHERDWFDNPIETSGQFSGVVIAKTDMEILILTPEEAVKAADSIEVAFPDGIMADASIRQSDTIMGLAVVRVDISQIDEETAKKIEAIQLGNSYSIKQGDLVVAVGAPAGIVHSSDYGTISYVARNVHTMDSSSRIFYTNARGDAQAGTFLLNTAGEMIGWVTEAYDNEKENPMTAAVAISDYKGMLEKMSNGIPIPYLGIRGQEVNQEMAASGIPLGVYIISVEGESPVYESGIQPGDILIRLNGETVANMGDFQAQLEKLCAEDKVAIGILRSGNDGYKEIEFTVTVGAR